MLPIDPSDPVGSFCVQYPPSVGGALARHAEQLELTVVISQAHVQLGSNKTLQLAAHGCDESARLP